MHWGKKLNRSFLWLSGHEQGMLAPKSLPTQEDARSRHHNATLVLAESWGGWSRRNTTTEHIYHPPYAAGSLALGSSFLFGCLLLIPTEYFCRAPSLCSFFEQKMNPQPRAASFTLQVRTGPTWRSWWWRLSWVTPLQRWPLGTHWLGWQFCWWWLCAQIVMWPCSPHGGCIFQQQAGKK